MNMKKFSKTLLTIVIAAIIMVLSTATVNAVDETITLGNPKRTNAYIAGLSFEYKVTASGTDLYCLNYHKNTAKNTTAKLVKDSKYIDGGLIYILKNGYPNKSITGDSDKDYYITQTAVWWYLDSTKGMANLSDSFKQTGADSYGLRQHVKKLVDDGIAHKNDSYGLSAAKLALTSVNGFDMQLKDSYYISNTIKAEYAESVYNYTVEIKNAPKGTIIVKSNGTEEAYKQPFKLDVKDSFKIKVPVKQVTTTKLTIEIEATSDKVDQYTAYEYQPVDSSMQNIAILVKQSTSAGAKIGLNIDSSYVSIIKVDAKTNKPVAGAKLVLKDSTGKELARWTTTTNAHIIRNLADGNYTVEEIEAPDGYLLNKKVTKFTIDNKHRSAKITVENTPKNVVVNITKIDAETNEALAGAVLLVKDLSGKEIARFTTTNTSYVLKDLANGTYTVEEVSAPAGYKKSDDVIKFTIDDEHLSHQIVFKNTKEVPVPNTSSIPSGLLIVLGIVLTGTGISYIRKHANAN